MKNRRRFRSLAVLLAALALLGGFSVTAYAQTPTEETDDSGVIYEPQPLTPEGNMTLVDDISGEAAEDKQFIVVQSRNGNYFYIVIDNAAEGENKVHFLNQVDEADLLSIIESEETQQAPVVCICTDKCSVGHINTSCPVCSVNMAGCSGKEAAPQPDEQTEQPQQNDKQGSMGGLALILVLALLGGGVIYYFKVVKPKQNTKGGTDLDELDFDEFDEDDTDELDEDTQEDER